MITIETKLGDEVTDWYGDVFTVAGESNGGRWWVLENTISGRLRLALKVTAGAVIITGQGA